jgi:pimeloyl-ACP methyl ester carboxylesterase
MIELTHARLGLALHSLQVGEGTPLLLLHALGGSAADWQPAAIAWDGAVYALDLSGHGYSGRLYGGGYCAELWAADADIALAHIGVPPVVAGAGLGAYVALLLAGARPDDVAAVGLLSGAGLHAGGPVPAFGQLELVPSTILCNAAIRAEPALDSAVLSSEGAVRPTDYAQAFAAQARRVLLVEDGTLRPAWWEAVRELEHVEVYDGELASALQLLAEPVTKPVRARRISSCA